MQSVLLGDIVKVIKGISYRSVDYSQKGKGLAFINLKCVNRGGGFRHSGVKYYKGEYKQDQKVAPGDILVANTDLTQDRDIIGSPIFMPDLGEDACFSLDLSKLEIIKPDLIDKNYLFYYLKAPLARNYMISHSNGSTVMHLSVSSIPNMRLELPDLYPQKQVAGFLDAIDKKIELNLRMNETLEQMGQALFKHYFIDNPEAQTWPKAKFSDFTEVSTGKGSTKSKLATGGQYPLYGANGIMGTSDEFLFNEPLIITGRVGSLGNVRAIKNKVWLSDNVLYFRPRNNAFGFVYQTAKTFDYLGLNRGSTQPLITQTDLKNQTVTKPDEKILQKFEEQFSVLLEKNQINDSENQNLVKLRDSLLPRLISGKIKV